MIVELVDGPANRKKDTGGLGNQASAKRSIHAKLPATQIREIQFLEYRLDVIQSWPDSQRKQIMMQSIEERLAAIRSLPPHR